MSASVLLVEDEKAIQIMVAFHLKQVGHNVVCADDAEQALSIIHDKLPDLVLLDCMLPGISGIELLRRLRADERTHNIPIILLTARAQEEDKVEGLNAGADDYITKPFSPRELLSRIRAVLRRSKPHVSDDVIKVNDLMLDPASHRVESGGRLIKLGPTEFRLLYFFMSHPERVYSRSQLLDHIWGDHVFIEERTVDVHIKRLRTALKMTRHNGLLETVHGTGYRFSHQPPKT